MVDVTSDWDPQAVRNVMCNMIAAKLGVLACI